MADNLINPSMLVAPTMSSVGATSLTSSVAAPTSINPNLKLAGSTVANLSSPFLKGVGNKIGGLFKGFGAGGIGDISGVTSGLTNIFNAQGNTNQQQMQRADGAVDTVAAGLSFIPGWGQAAGAALKLVNGLGAGLVKESSTMKNYRSNQNVLQNAAAFGGVADKANDAQATKDSFKNAGLFGRLVGKNRSTDRLVKANQVQYATQGVLDENQKALANQGSADLFNTRTQFNQMGGSNLFNKGVMQFGRKGLKFQYGGSSRMSEGFNLAKFLGDTYDYLNTPRKFPQGSLSTESQNAKFKAAARGAGKTVADQLFPSYPRYTSASSNSVAPTNTESVSNNNQVLTYKPRERRSISEQDELAILSNVANGKPASSGIDMEKFAPVDRMTLLDNISAGRPLDAGFKGDYVYSSKEVQQMMAPIDLGIKQERERLARERGEVSPKPSVSVGAPVMTSVQRTPVATSPSKNIVRKSAPTVSELWQKVTGTSWNQAKANGLTDGSFKQNIALLGKLKSGVNPLAELQNKKKEDFKRKMAESFNRSVKASFDRPVK